MVNIRFILMLLFIPSFMLGNHTSVPFQSEKGLIIVEAEINDHGGLFILDTGASDILINKKLVSSSTQFKTAHGDIEAEEIRLDEIQLGLINARNLSAYAMDLSHIEKHLDLEIAGILGGRSLYHGIIEINKAREVIIFHTDVPGVEKPMNRIDYSIVEGVPVCTVVVENDEHAFILDSGASNHFFDKRFIAQHTKSFHPLDNHAVVFSATSEKVQEKYLVSSLDLEGLKLQEVKVTSGDYSTLLENTTVSGLLSLTELSKGSIFIDTKNQVVLY